MDIGGGLGAQTSRFAALGASVIMAMPVTERFHQLGVDMREKHDIVEPVCLYTKEDFGRLAEDAGFSAMQITQSHFGTLKGIFALRCEL